MCIAKTKTPKNKMALHTVERSPPPSYEDSDVNAEPPAYEELVTNQSNGQNTIAFVEVEHTTAPTQFGWDSVPMICPYCSRVGMTRVRHKHLWKKLIVGSVLLVA